MQNVLIVCEESAGLMCWAPERIEEATGGVARKTPKTCSTRNFYSGLLRRGGGLQFPARVASALLLSANL